MFLNLDVKENKIIFEVEAFQKLDLKTISKIFPYIQEKKYRKGNYIYQTGQNSDFLYIIVSGRVMIFSNSKVMNHKKRGSDKKHWIIGKPIYDEIGRGKTCGEESLLEDYAYRANAFAASDVKVLVIPRTILLQISEANKKFKESLVLSMIDHYILDSPKENIDVFKDEDPFSEEDEVKEIHLDKASSLNEIEIHKATGSNNIQVIFSWILLLLFPIALYQFLNYYDIEHRIKIFLLILSITVLMWILKIVPEFVANLFAVTAIIVSDIVPSTVIFSGFASGSFYMAMSVFGIAFLFVDSGLAYRFVLYLLRVGPNSQIFYLVANFFFCFLIVPIFPSANGRIILMSPLLLDMLESFEYKKGKAAANLLTVATFNGLTLLSAGFLSSKLIHFAVYGLFSSQVAEQFGWIQWFISSLAYIFFVLFVFFLFCFFFFANREVTMLSKRRVSSQLTILGKISYKEVVSFLTILIFMIGILTNTFHHVDISWLAMIILFALLGLNFITKSNFKNKIDWAFLIYLGTLLGIVRSMDYLNFNDFIIKFFDYAPLNFIVYFMKNNLVLFILSLSLLIGIMRIFIPGNAVAVLMVSIFLPIGREYAINEWVLAFIILSLSDNWFFSYQSTYYQAFLDMTNQSGYYNEKIVTFFSGFLMSCVKIMGLILSIPFWRYLEII